MYFIYFIQSTKNRKIYVGLTSKTVQERLKEHNAGSNQWSKNNRPFISKYFEKFHCLKDAREREQFYKSGFGKQIKYLIIKYLEEKSIGV